MDIVKGAGGILTGGLGGLAEQVVSVVSGQFPEKMSEAEKAQLTLAIKEIEHKKEIELLQAWNIQEGQFQKFTVEMEGSAKDLLVIPIFGRLIVFLRAALRPIISALTIYADMMIWSGGWNLAVTAGANADQAWSLLWMINMLVLSVLFGERAMQNILPLVEKIIEKSVLGKPDTK